MITNTQLKILNVFRENLFNSLTFRQIKTLSKQKSNSVVQLALNEFLKQKLIKKNKVDTLNIYSLNMESDLCLSYLAVLNNQKIQNSNFPVNILENVKQLILNRTDFFSLIVFGSYAAGKAHKNSDLDIAIIVDSDNIKKDIIPIVETVKRRELINIDYHIFSRSEFIEMLTVDYENVGKQIEKKNIVYYGYIPYCTLISGVKYVRRIVVIPSKIGK